MTEPYVFEDPPLMESQDGQKLAEYLARQLLNLGSALQPNALTWAGYWADGAYSANNLVVDNGWLAVARRDTTDAPSPQPVGDVRNIINVPGAPTFATNSVVSGSLIVGTRYTFPSQVYIRAARFQAPAAAAGLRFDAWIVLDPDTDPSFYVLASADVVSASDTGKWVELPVGLTFVQDARKIDIIAAYTPATGSTSFTYQWDYKRKNGNPPAKEIWHQSGSNSNQIRVHEQDLTETDRSSDLNNIAPGSQIEMLSGGNVWSVLAASKSGDVYTFIVQPASRAQEAVSNFEFQYFGALSISYLEALNHYNTLPDVNGFLSTSGYNPTTAPPVLNQNAYGVDIQVQEVLTSDDWEFLAFSG